MTIENLEVKLEDLRPNVYYSVLVENEKGSRTLDGDYMHRDNEGRVYLMDMDESKIHRIRPEHIKYIEYYTED